MAADPTDERARQRLDELTSELAAAGRDEDTRAVVERLRAMLHRIRKRRRTA